MCSFFKAVDFPHPPPSELLSLQNLNNLVTPYHKDILYHHYSQIGHKPGPQRPALLIECILKAAYFELQTEFISVPLFNVLYNPSQGPFRAYANQFDLLFLINGMIDIGYSSPVPFPLMTKDDFSTISQDQQDKLTNNLNRLNSLFECGEFPVLFDDKGFPVETYHQVPKLPKPFSTAFSLDSDHLTPFPFLDIIIDTKRIGTLNSVQMLTNLYAQLASQACKRGIDEPSVGVGIVTNGYEWTFVVFQLNTLELGHTQTGPRNVVWCWTERMSLSGSECDLRAYFTLKNILSVAIRYTLERKMLIKK
eukprot:TRINITY_DN16248_c0_g1_i1.p1 TRINITY_DN16248_c0_g1~~TRINITY_DN16248_c0_g1_i1.p1  ORF type:complete len:331 (-),score=62.93 TRINITY_DN16248_c0_g1_i1:44-964(-)